MINIDKYWQLLTNMGNILVNLRRDPSQIWGSDVPRVLTVGVVAASQTAMLVYPLGSWDRWGMLQCPDDFAEFSELVSRNKPRVCDWDDHCRWFMQLLHCFTAGPTTRKPNAWVAHFTVIKSFLKVSNIPYPPADAILTCNNTIYRAFFPHTIWPWACIFLGRHVNKLSNTYFFVYISIENGVRWRAVA